MIIITLILQFSTLDFIFIEGENSISWDGLGLDGLLEKDDWVEISYSFFYH